MRSRIRAIALAQVRVALPWCSSFPQHENQMIYFIFGTSIFHAAPLQVTPIRKVMLAQQSMLGRHAVG